MTEQDHELQAVSIGIAVVFILLILSGAALYWSELGSSEPQQLDAMEVINP